MRLLNYITNFSSSKKGSKIIFFLWLIFVIVASGVMPASKEVSVSSTGNDLPSNFPSVIAEQLKKESFSEEGLPAFLVFYQKDGLKNKELQKISEISRWLNSQDRPEHIEKPLPFHTIPEQIQLQMLSENQTTFLFPVTFQDGLETKRVNEEVQQISKKIEEIGTEEMQFEITGPAGIASDTIEIFSNADLVLLFSTIGLILVILIVIYRSPLLALLPLVVAGIVYQGVDRLLGWGAKNGWFVVEGQAASIMTILLFAALTDYCLFIVARYREELQKNESKFIAMNQAMQNVGEAIFFSGGTVLIAVVCLFATQFQPYHNFAPVFSIAMVLILLSGLTLIPALFTMTGRKSFWPFVPKLGDMKEKKVGLWGRIAIFVTKKPKWITVSVLLLLTLLSLNVRSIPFSFNLLDSFPEELSSRQGFQLIEKSYPKGELAPVTVLVKSNQKFELNSANMEHINKLAEQLKQFAGVDSVTPKLKLGMDQHLLSNVLSKDKHVISLKLTFKESPYSKQALDQLESIRNNANVVLQKSGLDEKVFSLHFAGQTAIQLDIRDVNERDTFLTIGLVLALITMMLIFQSRSFVAALYMICTILLSYGAAMGLGWFIFHDLLGYDAMSYRLPLYTFVFLVALGVDYNIMVISRIREELKHHGLQEAVRRGMTFTGEVISSAGFILAATFGVLMTQPLLELFMFGFIVAIGVLMDTFIVRGMLVPALVLLFGNWNGWKETKGDQNVHLNESKVIGS